MADLLNASGKPDFGQIEKGNMMAVSDAVATLDSRADAIQSEIDVTRSVLSGGVDSGGIGYLVKMLAEVFS